MGSTIHVYRHEAESLRLVNTTGVALVQDEYTIMRGQGLKALEAIGVSPADGALENVNGCEIQCADFDTGEATFAAADLPVYWDPSSKKFSNTASVGHWLIGYSKAAIASGILDVIACEPVYVSDGIATLASAIADHIADTSDAHDASAISVLDSGTLITATNVEAALAEIVGAGRSTETIKGNATAIAAITELAGRSFMKKVTLTAAAAGTAQHIVAAAAVGTLEKVYVSKIIAQVNGGTAWSDSTGTGVTIQDTADSPVVGATIAKASLTGDVILQESDAAIVLGDAIGLGSGFTADKGLDLVADSNFDAGSDLVVTVFGFIM